MKIPGHNVISMMQTYAERNNMPHSKVNDYVQNADFGALAKQIEKDLDNLANVIPQR